GEQEVECLCSVAKVDEVVCKFLLPERPDCQLGIVEVIFYDEGFDFIVLHERATQYIKSEAANRVHDCTHYRAMHELRHVPPRREGTSGRTAPMLLPGRGRF